MEMGLGRKKFTSYDAYEVARHAVVNNPSVMPRRKRQIAHGSSQALANTSISEYNSLRTRVDTFGWSMITNDSQTACCKLLRSFARQSPSPGERLRVCD